MRRLLCIPALVALLLACPAARADETKPIEPAKDWVDHEEGTPVRPIFELINHGAFRFRADLFWRADLGTQGFTGILRPVLENDANPGFHNGWASKPVIASANIRFRYEPELRIGERVRIFAQVDFLENLVLGSTPPTGFGRSWGLWQGEGEGQVPPASKVSDLKDSARAKRLWGELTLFDAIVVRLGRMPDQWGLGILRNAGYDPDDDFGASVDRIEAVGSYWGFNFGFSWDFIIEGLTSQTRAQALGQPYGLGTADDVHQWTIFVSQEPFWPAELAARQKALWEEHRPVVDWGVMSMFRIEEDTSEQQASPDTLAPSCFLGPDPALDLSYDCATLARRKVFLWYPDAWGRVQWSPAAGRLLRVEAEIAMVYGSVTGTEPTLQNTNSTKHVLQVGAAVKSEYRMDAAAFGLDFGVASGDDTHGLFGIVGDSEVVDFHDPTSRSAQVRDHDLTNFKFSRAFRVDQLLYREVIGGVTNSFFFKPWASYDFWRHGEHTLGARLDVLYARAIVRDGTPGDAYDLGVETDLTGYYRLGTGLDARLIFAALFPFAGLDNVALSLHAKPAVTLQANIFWSF